MSHIYKEKIEKYLKSFKNKFASVEVFGNHSYLKKDYETVFWKNLPFTENYYTPIPRVFLSQQIADQQFLQRFDFIISRDGLSDTLRFFVNHPKPPKKFKNIIIIPKIFESIIPKEWMNHTLTYAKEYTSGAVKKEKIIIIAVFNDSFFSDEYLNKMLNKICKAFKPGADIKIAFEVKPNGLFEVQTAQWDEFNAQKINSAIFLAKKFNVSVESLRSLTNNKWLSDYSYIFLNENSLSLYDDSVTHKLLELGATQFEDINLKTIQKSFFELDISPGIKFKFFEPNFSKNNLFTTINEELLEIKNFSKKLSPKRMDKNFTLDKSHYYYYSKLHQKEIIQASLD